MCGCSTSTPVLPVEPTATFIPYFPSTPIPTKTLVLPPITPLPTVGPTATPFVHIVEKEDTLLGIAIRYGVSLEELLAVNPGINPTILSIGQQIIIPGLEGDPDSNFLPMATPIPLSFSEVICFTTRTEHLWCISTLTNGESFSLEGVSVILSLLSEKGEVIDSRTAYSPINLIPSGVIVPLSVLFAIPPGGYANAVLVPASAYPAENVDEGYISLDLILEMDEPGEDMKSWFLGGRLVSPVEDEKVADHITILAVALDKEGIIVGFRKIEIESELITGDGLPFEIEVYSLGPDIDHVDIIVEARVTSAIE